MGSCNYATGLGAVFYGVQVEVRHVLTKQVDLIPSANPLDRTYTGETRTSYVTLRGRQASYTSTSWAEIFQRIHVTIPPTQTCQSPSVEEGTVHFGTVNQSNFPNNQWGAATYRDFTLTFRHCPRINLRYYVHANGNKWVDSARGVVGVQGSDPGEPDPVEGNPSGFAIQLQHRNDNRNQTNSGMNVYIHPNEVAYPLALSTTGNNRQAYQRTYYGAGTFDDPTLGVTHTIPLRARLVRTGSSSQQQITPGAFTTSVIVAIHYP